MNSRSSKSPPPPKPPTSHGESTANADPVRSNIVKPGRFGFLFPELSSSPWTTGSAATDAQVAEELGDAMHAGGPPTPGVIPAGFTYFGQFVDHDITFDPTSIGENAVDVADLVNFRTPALDLDSLYGSGPRDQPFLYRRQTDTKSNSSSSARWPTPRADRARTCRPSRIWTARRTTCPVPASGSATAPPSWATSETTRT
nr:hypothetical protein [Variovorax paradoxus]